MKNSTVLQVWICTYVTFHFAKYFTSQWKCRTNLFWEVCNMLTGTHVGRHFVEYYMCKVVRVSQKCLLCTSWSLEKCQKVFNISPPLDMETSYMKFYTVWFLIYTSLVGSNLLQFSAKNMSHTVLNIVLYVIWRYHMSVRGISSSLDVHPAAWHTALFHTHWLKKNIETGLQGQSCKWYDRADVRRVWRRHPWEPVRWKLRFWIRNYLYGLRGFYESDAMKWPLACGILMI